MMNEELFVLSALVDLGFVAFAAWRGREWLFATIATNLILISIFGAKLVTVFGLLTNVGNVFYACVFLATHFLLEQHGEREGTRAIWFGAGFIGLFFILSQLAARFVGSPLSDSTNTALVTLFESTLRVTLASILAYLFAQKVNTRLYLWIAQQTGGRYLWLRSNGANIIAQLVDSILFFSIAFIDLSGPLLVQSILAGWFIKSLVVFLGTPFFYLERRLPRVSHS
jgi:uncharacterized integral membrane protein (TIGR00697 family)